MTSKNVKIAKELVRIARQLVAGEECFLVFDENGMSEVSSGEFNHRFASSSRRRGLLAGQGTINPFPSSKAVFSVSPNINVQKADVEAKDLLTLDGIKKGLAYCGSMLKNIVRSKVHDFNAEKKIFKMIQESQDSSRYPNGDDFALGATITTGHGLYTSTDTGKTVREKSYIITLFGITHAEAERLANRLRDYFEQESVLVEFIDYEEGNPEKPGAMIDFVEKG